MPGEQNPVHCKVWRIETAFQMHSTSQLDSQSHSEMRSGSCNRHAHRIRQVGSSGMPMLQQIEYIAGGILLLLGLWV